MFSSCKIYLAVFQILEFSKILQQFLFALMLIPLFPPPD